MVRKPPTTYLPLWQRALDSEIGVAFQVSGVRRDYFRKTLYDARQASGDPRLNDIAMFLPAAPHDNEIWLCRKTVELED